MHFVIDGTALLIVIALLLFFVFFWMRHKKSPKPFFFFPQTHSLKQGTYSWRIAAAHWPQLAKSVALVLFCLAFIDPHFSHYTQSSKEAKKRLLSTDGIAIYLLLDKSGSMGGQVIDESSQEGAFISKEDLLKNITKRFIKGDPKIPLKGRESDLIGLVAFARTPQVLSPLTLDHDAVLNEVDKIEVVSTPEENGTAIGYAIYKTANIIAATKHFSEKHTKNGISAYKIKNAVILLVTDGFQNPHSEDKADPLRAMSIAEAAQFAKQNDVRLYIVNIDPAITNEEFAPHRRLFQKDAEVTGGKFYAADTTQKLQEVYADIDKLEKTSIPRNVVSNTSMRAFSLAPLLLFFGIVLLALGVVLETTVLRRAP